jgi:ABC-type dipeptide/oligopeptide/nickel transport system ATPase component
MKINLPELSLVVLVGTTGSGKSTFARAHFLPTEIMSSDFFRGLVADDENDQSATGRLSPSPASTTSCRSRSSCSSSSAASRASRRTISWTSSASASSAISGTS